MAPAGARIRLVWTPDRLDSARIEFLREGKKWIESNEFRDCCSDFVDRVIRRLIAFGVEGTLLQEEWAAIQAAGADESKFCGVAAGLGWDPYALNDAERAAVLRLDDVLDEAVLEEAVEGHAIGEDPDAVENVTQPRHFGAAALLDGVVTSDATGRPAFAIRHGGDDVRRFQFCRGLAEVLVSPGSDALLTQARSDRQQRSRAFAAEFVAPSSGLRARLSRAVVGEHDVDAVAAEFGVSPLLVAHQLRNHDIARIR